MQKSNLNYNTKRLMILSSIIFLIVCSFTYLLGRGLSIENSFAVVNATKITITPSSKTIEVGGEILLVATIEPSNTTDKSIKWTSSNNTIATVSSTGVVTGKSAGKATIIAATSNGKKAISIITVKEASSTPQPTPTIIYPSGISVNPASLSIELGEKRTLSATISPSNATNKNVTWSSSDSTIVEVNSKGLITAKKVGKAIITVKTSNNKTANAIITVTKEEIIEPSSYEEPSIHEEPSSYLEPSTYVPDERPVLNINIKLLIVAGVMLGIFMIGAITYFAIKNKKM